MSYKHYKDESRLDWGKELCEQQSPTMAELQFGAILRIADAAELMAKNHQQLTEQRDLYKRWYEQQKQIEKMLCRRIAGLQGYITKLKKKK